MRALLSSCRCLAAAFAVAACQAPSTPAPPADPTTTTTTPPPISATATPTPTPTLPAPASPDPVASAAPPTPVATGALSDPNDYSACATDADCEIVPRAGCCDNGYKAAIARGKGDAYRRTNACSKKVMCPHFMISDRRAAACNPQKHVCEMVGAAPPGASP